MVTVKYKIILIVIIKNTITVTEKILTRKKQQMHYILY